MLMMRGHNEGSLFLRRTGPGKGSWVAVVTMRDGHRASRVAHSREAGKAALAELLRLRDARAPVTRNIRLSAYLERWVSDVSRLAPSTRRKHESEIRVHLTPGLGHHRLSELRVQDVDDALALFRDRGLGPQSVLHVRATLRRALADAVRDGLVTRNVAALSRPPGLTTNERTILDATQARILIESTRTTRYGPLWTILVTTGLRISEALGLSWSDVELGGNDGGSMAGAAPPEHGGHGRANPRGVDRTQGPSITVRRQLARENGEWVHRPPKTAKGRRTVPLTPLGVQALRDQRRQQDGDLGDKPRPIDGLVFTTTTGQPHHETNTLKALQADLHAADLPRVTQHDLRHSCATLLYSMGVPLETIADILGHSSVRVTQDLYRHRVAELQQDAADKMQAALG